MRQKVSNLVKAIDLDVLFFMLYISRDRTLLLILIGLLCILLGFPIENIIKYSQGL